MGAASCQKSINFWEEILRKYPGKKYRHESNEERLHKQQRTHKRVTFKRNEEGGDVREWWADGDRGVDYSLFLTESFFCVGVCVSFPLHYTQGADNRWSYHYRKTCNPHSNSLGLCCGWQCVHICARMHLITAHYVGKSDNNPQPAAGCSLHLHLPAVIVLIAIWSNYWESKGKPDWVSEASPSLYV